MHLYKLVIVYQTSNNSSYTFALKNYYGGTISESEVSNSGSGTHKIEKIFVHDGTPDLTYLQAKRDGATGGGWRVMSAKLYVCSA